MSISGGWTRDVSRDYPVHRRTAIQVPGRETYHTKITKPLETEHDYRNMQP